MRIKKQIILALLIISFLSFSYSSAKISFVTNDDYTDFFYSDHIVPGEELIWNVAKFDKEAGVNWTIKSGYLVEEGDTIKFEIILDPDTITLSDIMALHSTETKWADFYLNDDYLGNDVSALNLFISPFELDYVFWAYLLPTELEIAAANTSTFDYLYDMAEPMQYDNESGLYEVIMTDDLVTFNWEYHEDEYLFFIGERVQVDEIIEISYNLEWGYLDRIRIYEFVKFGSEKHEVELILMNSRSTQKVPISWTTGLFALFFIGLVAAYIRRR
ncbi:MAG: hypothetical protein FK730_09800 [Asgard group archaeon]|nr:hypothetical protein [Asgard group archaeon]